MVILVSSKNEEDLIKIEGARVVTIQTRIVRESDYSPASQLFLQGEKNNDR